MIAVVIPLYNKAPHIGRALESVVAQTLPAAEIVVVDDGSTDRGVLAAKQFEALGVQIVQQSNQGVSAARNAGVALTESPYIAFLDADDWWEPNHLEVIQELVSAFPSAALFSTAHQKAREGGIVRPRSIFQEGWQGEVPDFFHAYANGFALVNSSTAVVKRSAFSDVGGFPVGVKRGEDITVWVKLALLYPVAYSEAVTVVLDQQAVNRSHMSTDDEPPGSLRFMSGLLRDNRLTAAQHRGVARLFDRIALYTSAGFCLNGNRMAALSIGALAYRTGRAKVGLLVTTLLLVPGSILSVARRLRHRRVSAE